MNTNEDNSISEFEEKPVQPQEQQGQHGRVHLHLGEAAGSTWSRTRQTPTAPTTSARTSSPRMLDDRQAHVRLCFRGLLEGRGHHRQPLGGQHGSADPCPCPSTCTTPSGASTAATPAWLPHFIAEGASVRNSLITEGCEVYGHVDHSVIFSGVTIAGGRHGEGQRGHARRGH